jgi:hypothetical protein
MSQIDALSKPFIPPPQASRVQCGSCILALQAPHQERSFVRPSRMIVAVTSKRMKSSRLMGVPAPTGAYHLMTRKLSRCVAEKWGARLPVRVRPGHPAAVPSATVPPIADSAKCGVYRCHYQSYSITSSVRASGIWHGEAGAPCSGGLTWPAQRASMSAAKPADRHRWAYKSRSGVERRWRAQLYWPPI